VFRFGYRDRSVTVQLRPGFVTNEFVALARTDGLTPAEEKHLTLLKQQMAERLLAVPADQVYDVADR
jgi:hypothetical protein